MDPDSNFSDPYLSPNPVTNDDLPLYNISNLDKNIKYILNNISNVDENIMYITNDIINTTPDIATTSTTNNYYCSIEGLITVDGTNSITIIVDLNHHNSYNNDDDTATDNTVYNIDVANDDSTSDSTFGSKFDADDVPVTDRIATNINDTGNNNNIADKSTSFVTMTDEKYSVFQPGNNDVTDVNSNTTTN